MSIAHWIRLGPLALCAIALPWVNATRPSPIDQEDSQEAAAMLDSTPLRHLKPLLGTWEGTISGTDADANAWSVPIRWQSQPTFENRYLRFEFSSTGPRPNGRFLEYAALFTWNAELKQVETIWMSPQLRVPGPTKYLDGPMVFFETGTFDETGTVLTLISQQKQAEDAEAKPVRSTFRIIDQDRFTVVDEHRDDTTGEWSASGTFKLRRVE